jgi:hypothetical protein
VGIHHGRARHALREGEPRAEPARTITMRCKTSPHEGAEIGGSLC